MDSSCRSTDIANAHANNRSRSGSPRFNISDFEQLHLPQRAFTQDTRDTSYGSQAPIDDLDFARSRSASKTPPLLRSKSIRNSFLGRTSKLLPKAITTAGQNSTPPSSLPASGASSPTKTLASFISTTPSSASRASVRARTASKSQILFDNYFTGDSAPVALGPLQSHSRSLSRSSSRNTVAEEGYEPDSENMAPTHTKPLTRTRSKRTPTADSTASYASKLGSWFSATNKPAFQKFSRTMTSPASEAEGDDPLLSLDIQRALFPYGPVDPLDPSSFNDLLSSAEAAMATLQNAYRQRVAELANVTAELALKQDEMEECETRTQHLKLQLQDLGEQCTAQTQKADSLESMLRERASEEEAVVDEGSRSRLSSRGGRRSGSDSGFESDGESLHEAAMARERETMVKGQRQHQSSAPMFASQPLFSNDLRSENEMLRMRVAELEGAVEGCLDMISGPFALGR